jgi:hypothetical protein
MRFEILGEISDIETFATGSGIREITACGGATGGVDGVNARECLRFDYLMVQSM